jgi:hypothetical protein
MSFVFHFISSVSIQLSVSHICAISLHEKDRQRVVAFKALADMLSVDSNPQREELLAGGYIKK